MLEAGGKIRYQRRFSFSPSCLIAYHLGDFGDDIYVGPGEDKDEVLDNAISKQYDSGGLQTPGFVTVVGSFEGYLNIYKDIKLAWTSKLQI